MAHNVLGLVLSLFGCVLILVNTTAVVSTIRSHRSSMPRHYSGISFIPQLLTIFAALSFNAAPHPWLPAWLPLVIGACDPGLWRLLYLTLGVIRDRPKKKPE
ncbi:MAG TPA: hypothetical protein VKT74_06890 [Gammaproteobacteria bacterium]|nr:hypothetical protein [Gammaproteobacteria bacterium]